MTILVNPLRFPNLFPEQYGKAEFILDKIDGENHSFLSITYFFPNEADSGRNYEAFDIWREKGKVDGKKVDKLDEKIHDTIYRAVNSRVHDLEYPLSKEDKVALEVNIGIKERAAHVFFISRNKDSDLKGVGTSFYQNLAGYLHQQGIKEIYLQPAAGLVSYWENLGFKEDKKKCVWIHTL